MDRMQEIKLSIWEKLRRRLAAEAGSGAEDVEMFDRVLALWIDLRRAIHLSGESECLKPWSSPNRQISEAWTALTEPNNARALEQLFRQMPEGPEMEWARKAFEVAREHQRHLPVQTQSSLTPASNDVSQM